MKTFKQFKVVIRATVVLAFVATAVAAQMQITRSTVDGGGVLRSTGGTMELSGTIGQPDAGLLTGGSFELTGGFWFKLMPTDCNEDGAVNLVDHSSFRACLAGPATAPPAGCACFDANRDGTVDLRDFVQAQIGFSGS